MREKVKIDDISSKVVEWLTEYDESVTDVAKQVVDEIAEGTLSETKAHISWNDKKYSNSFALNTSFENKRNKRRTWYVKSPHYRLTHLLEFGHLTRDGQTKTRAFPHVRYGDEYVKNNFERIMKERIEQCRI